MGRGLCPASGLNELQGLPPLSSYNLPLVSHLRPNLGSVSLPSCWEPWNSDQQRTGRLMGTERRKGERVTFERGFPAHMMGIDGTWRRNCLVEDISETGAKMTVEGSVEGLNLKEFFLLLSSTGLAYRRCELSWVNGEQIGVGFLKPDVKKKPVRRGANAQVVEI